METVELLADLGRETGSPSARRLRKDGLVPAVIYGKGEEPISVTVKYPELRAALSGDAGLNALINLKMGSKTQLSLVKDLQRHPVRQDVIHVDFVRIDSNSEVLVDVPLILTGEAKKVTQASGMVDQVMYYLSVRAKVDDIPTDVSADVSDLEVGTSLQVGDLELPPGVSVAGDPDATFAVGLITRSTKEYLRRLKAEEEGELEEGEEPTEGDAEPSDDSGDDEGPEE